MALPKNLTVGVDFSEPSRQALRRAGDLARRGGAPLHVVYVLKGLPYEESLNPATFLQLTGAAEEELAAKLIALAGETLGEELLVETEVRLGAPDRELVAAARAHEAQLLVVGSHGKSALQRFFLGSVAESVVFEAEIPVWVERAGAPEQLQELLLPTDLSPHSRVGVLAGLDWARLLGVSASLLHVAETHYIPPLSMINPQDYERKMHDLAAQHFEKFADSLPLDGLSVRRELRVGHPAEEIEKAAQARPGSLLVLSTRGHGNSSVRALGSVANRLLRHAPCSTLFIPSPETVR